MHEVTFDAPTNAGNHVMSNIACGCYQQRTNDLTFWLAQMTFFIITLCKFPLLVGPNVILKCSHKHVTMSMTLIPCPTSPPLPVSPQAIGDLLEYLDSNLLTLNTNLLKTNFDRILESIWVECLEEFREALDTEEAVSPSNYLHYKLYKP